MARNEGSPAFCALHCVLLPGPVQHVGSSVHFPTFHAHGWRVSLVNCYAPVFFQPRLGNRAFSDLLTVPVLYSNIFNSFQIELDGFRRHVGPLPTNASHLRCLYTLTCGVEKYMLVIACKHTQWFFICHYIDLTYSYHISWSTVYHHTYSTWM